MDREISDRTRKYNIIECDYDIENGKIKSTDYPYYKKRENHVTQKFNEKFLRLEERLDRLCKIIRRSQPDLNRLNAENIRKNGIFPENIVLGRMNVRFENLDIFVPRAISFPISKPICISDLQHNERIHKLFLRLMYALPFNKLEFNIFDTMGLGRSVKCFNKLFKVEELFPEKKILSDLKDLKRVLKKNIAYVENLIQNVFLGEIGDWYSYNKKMCRDGQLKKVLPYKVFALFDLPEGMDDEAFDMLYKLTIHAEECGLLIIYSYNSDLFESELGNKYGVADKRFIKLKKILENSARIESLVKDLNGEFKTQNIEIEELEEMLPSAQKISELVDIFSETIQNEKKRGTDITDLINVQDIFDMNSTDGLSVPIGYNDNTGEVELLEIGDRVPHYLIGGTTGSGKSNLLHNIILSACNHYNAEELNLYLLDFKEGVEFSVYANPMLTQAALIACEADTEYGVSVLTHLVEEMQERYAVFKQAGVKDYSSYRKQTNGKIMPRILLIVDEFQVLFDGASKAGTIEMMKKLTKQGRACGLHIIMATQSLNGLDFSMLNSQFGGRIALKCSAGDSKMILGGGAVADNMAAAELDVPYAIVNTGSGSIDGNRKFAVPYAAAEAIEQITTNICTEHGKLGIKANTKVYYGDSLPTHPTKEQFSSEELCFKLGVERDYDAEEFRIYPKNSQGNNIIICGAGDELTNGLMKSVMLSADGCALIDEIIYIGEKSVSFGDIEKKTISYSSTADFIDSLGDDFYSKKRTVIFDNCNLSREVNYPEYGTPQEKAQMLTNYLQDANKNGSIVIAFYERYSLQKNACLPAEEFCHRICYNMNGNDIPAFIGNLTMTAAFKDLSGKRVMYAENGIFEGEFKPYTEEKNE